MLQGQSGGSISGSVVDHNSNDPLMGANVQILDSLFGYEAD